MANVNVWRLAGTERITRDRLEAMLGGKPQLEMSDAGSGWQRFAHFEGERLKAVLMIEPSFAFPALDWLDTLFGQDALSAAD